MILVALSSTFFLFSSEIETRPLHIMLYSAMRSSYSEVQCNGLLFIVHLALGWLRPPFVLLNSIVLYYNRLHLLH